MQRVWQELDFGIFQNFGTSVEVTVYNKKCLCFLQLYKINTSNLSQAKRERTTGTILCCWVRTLSGTEFWGPVSGNEEWQETFIHFIWMGWVGHWHIGEQWAVHVKNQKRRDHMEGWACRRSF